MKQKIWLLIALIFVAGSSFIIIYRSANISNYYTKITSNSRVMILEEDGTMKQEYVYVVEAYNEDGDKSIKRFKDYALEKETYLILHEKKGEIVDWKIINKKNVPPKVLKSMN